MKNAIFLALAFLDASSVLLAQNDSFPSIEQLKRISLEELMNIQVISASGYMQTTAEAPSTITVITAKQIAERGYEQLEDALRDVPGIDMIHVNGYVPTLIYFRGMYGAENQRALLMIDGVVENNIIGSNDMAGPAYNLHNVERIEVIWGPASALYGANAYGGLINIITKKGADINGLYAEKSYGSFNTSVDKIGAGMRKSNFEFAVAGTLYSTDGPKFKNRDPYYSGSYVDKAYGINTTISYYTKKTRTSFCYRTYRTPMGWGTYSNSPTMYLGLPPQGNGNVGIIGVISRDIRGERSGLDDAYLRTAFIQNEYTPNEKISILSRVVYRETGIGTDSYIYVTVDGTKLIRAIVAAHSNRILGEFSANYTLSKKQRFSAGAQFYQDNVEAGQRKTTFDPTVYLIDGSDTVINLHAQFLPREFDIRNNLGSYLQYILNTELLGNTSFTLGARYDRNSYFGDAVNPRIAIVNRPNNKWTFKLQFGKAFRAPSNLEIYQTPPGSDFKLKKEKIKTYEVNAIYTPSSNFRVQINGFHNRMTDVIIISNLSGLSLNKNPGIFKIAGMEALLDGAVTQNVSVFANFTYLHTWAKNLVTENIGKLPGVASVKGNAGITARLMNLFTVSVSGNWVGKRRTPITDPYGPVDGYFLANCAVSAENLFNKGISIGFNIRNMFNKKWLDPGFRTADGNLYSTVLEQPGINALFKAGIKL